MEVAGHELVQCLNCGMKFSELSCLVVCAVHTRTLITSRCNEPCRNWCIQAVIVPHQGTDHFKVVRLEVALL